MAAFRLLVCFLVSTLCFCSIINGAAVHSLIFSNESHFGNNDLGVDRGEIDGAGITDSVKVFVDKIRIGRSLDSEKSCRGTVPCGWAVYVPFKRRVEYFMRNTCFCPATYKCVRTDDDLSVSAYVYRCRNNVSSTDIVSPTEGN